MKNVAYFIAKRIHYNQEQDGKRVSPPAIRIAVCGIAVGLAIMLLSVAIVVGFKHEIQQKVIGFGSHLQISNFDSNATYETAPIAFGDSLLESLQSDHPIDHISRIATKPAVIKTDSAFLAVVIKGVDEAYHWDFFAANMVSGDTLHLIDSVRSNEVLLSQAIAQKLDLGLGDDFVSYFVQDGVRARKFTVRGIFQTNFTEYDQIFVMADLRHVQRLNGWKPDQVSALEVMVADFEQVDAVADGVIASLENKTDGYGHHFYVRSIRDLNPQIFSWLELLDLNVWVILILMSLVASFTMISGLLIIILERTTMIGVLKALGYSNWGVRKVFLHVAFFLIVKGMIWGNVIGLGLCAIQHYFRVITLDAQSYYLTHVPIVLNPLYIILLNLGTVCLALLVLLGPSYVITKISPAKSIRFD